MAKSKTKITNQQLEQVRDAFTWNIFIVLLIIAAIFFIPALVGSCSFDNLSFWGAWAMGTLLICLFILIIVVLFAICMLIWGIYNWAWEQAVWKVLRQ